MHHPASMTTAHPAPGPYDFLFNPRSIAVIGASNNGLKPGGRVINNISTHGYSGRLWAVNPNTAQILNLPTFTDIQALPAAPDLAIVAVSAPLVLPCLHELAAKHTRAVIILTSGFGEKDAQGRAMEQEMLAIAREAGMVLIGPNCSGFLTPAYKGKFAGIIPQVPGNAVDFISGSGATVDYVMEQACHRGLSFGSVVNLGNSIQMGVEDLLGLYDENYGSTSASILMLYLERVRKPAKLLRHARSLARKGCVLVGIKSGTTTAGERAAASHTGAMATNDTAVEALFAKAGIIRVRSKGELIDASCVLAAARGPLKGDRICVITDAGGPGVMMADELNHQGLQLPLLNDKTQARLRQILPPESATANPIDCLPSRTADQIQGILEILSEEEGANLDAVAVVTGNSLLSDNWDIYSEVRKAMSCCPLPIIPVFSSAVTAQEKIARYCSDGHIYFPDEVELARALGTVIRRCLPDDARSDPQGYHRELIAAALTRESAILSPEGVAQVLEGAGFKLPRQRSVHSRSDLKTACADVGFPLVMKVVGPLHKSDLGGVRVGLSDQPAADAAWEQLMTIEGAGGVLLQAMVAGTEVILGASREGPFGHLVMFGLGGIYTEVLKDVQFALAPLSKAEGRRMIGAIRAAPILKGLRGTPGADLDLLADYLVRLGRLVTDFPTVEEIDLNPIKGYGNELYAVDARIIQQTKPQP